MKPLRAVACFLFLVAFNLHAAGRSWQSSGSQQTTQDPIASDAHADRASSEQNSVDPAKVADIRRLLEVTGARALMTQVMTQMSDSLRPTMVQALPPGDYREQLVDLFFEKFRSKLNAQLLLDLAIPVYDKYLSEDEIKGLIQFYATPLGQKALRVLPKITSEMQMQGQQLGQRIGRDSMMEVLSEHPDLAKALEAAQKATRK